MFKIKITKHEKIYFLKTVKQAKQYIKAKVKQISNGTKVLFYFNLLVFIYFKNIQYKNYKTVKTKTIYS